MDKKIDKNIKKANVKNKKGIFILIVIFIIIITVISINRINLKIKEDKKLKEVAFWTEFEIKVFNNKFLSYEGKEIDGHLIDSLVKTVRASNEDQPLKVSIYGLVTLNSQDNNPQYSDSFDASNLYDVKMNYNEYGVIDSISIALSQ